MEVTIPIASKEKRRGVRPATNTQIRIPRPFIPTVIYKYTSPKWAEKMIRLGSVRVGTLYEYRRVEKVGPERVDVKEAKRIRKTDGKRHSGMLGDLPEFFESFYRDKKDPAAWVRVRVEIGEGSVIVKEENHPDMYVYCVSDRWSPALFKKFGGACVRINDSFRFLEEVCAQMALRAPFLTRGFDFAAGWVGYKPRAETWPNLTDYDPVLRKDPDWKGEHEVRAAWGPPSKPSSELEPQILLVPNAIQYFERLDESGSVVSARNAAQPR